MYWGKKFLLPHHNLDFLIAILLDFRELQFVSPDNKSMRWRIILVADSRSASVVDETALVCVETIIA